MSLIMFLLCALINSALSSAVPKLQNITISVPEGTKNHGNPNLLCFPTKAWDVVAFFLGNYVAHIATMKTPPGELPFDSFFNRLIILFMPILGMASGVICIYLAAYFQKTPLQVALKSCALCEVVRNQDWRPQDGDIIRNLKVSQEAEELLSKAFNPRTQNEESCETEVGKLEGQQWQAPTLRAQIQDPLDYSIFQPRQKWGFVGRQVYGVCKLPEGYSLTTLSTRSKAELCPVPEAGVSVINHPNTSPTSRTREDCWEISCSYSMTRPLIAMIQLFYGCLTLYRARGDQVKQYGYSTFGLTVAPYVIMSFINLCGALLTPSYSHLYLVSTMIMSEAQKRTEACFEGVVGTVNVSENSNSDEDESLSGGFTGIFEVNAEGEVKLRLSRPSYRIQEIDHDSINGSESHHGIRNGTFPQAFVVIEFQNEKMEPKKDNSASLPILEIPACQRPAKGRSDKLRDRILRSIMIIIGCMPIAVVGGFSHFQPGNSLPFQRGWTMAWYTVGIGSALLSILQNWMEDRRIKLCPVLEDLFSLVFVCMIFVPGIGGFVVVGKMIREYGSCSLIS